MGTATHDELLARLEAASAGSREMDWRIAEAFSIPEPWRVAIGIWPPFVPGSRYDKEIPSFTTSLDAALALAERVLPDLFWDLSCHAIISGERQHHAEVFPEVATVEQPSFSGHAPTPALALCIAILKARTAVEADSVGVSEANAHTPESPRNPGQGDGG